MKFEIKNRFTGAVQFTAEVGFGDDLLHSVKIGRAVKWGLRNNADLRGTDLKGAVLWDANLCGADLMDADLSGADLWDAALRNANLSGVDFMNANFHRADLRDANFRGASLVAARFRNANLKGADFKDADTWGVNLNGANILEANFRGADLMHATFAGAHGVNDFVKCIQLETYPVTYTAEIMQIGGMRCSIIDWRGFDDWRIRKMGGERALKFWHKYKDWIFRAIELCPAEPTRDE